MTKKAYWTIATLVIFVSTFHYSEVFSIYEHKGTLGIIVSWSMGIIFDAGMMLYMYLFDRIKSKSKYLTIIILVAFTFLFQFEYYSTIFETWKRICFSAVFPFMIVILAFISKSLNAKQDEEISNDEKELRRILGDNYGKQENQKKQLKKKLKKYQCPGCGNEYENYHRLNAHRPARCLEKHKEK